MKKEITSCPSNDTFERAFLGQMNDEEREAFVDHVFACHKCRIKFEALESLGRRLKNKEGEFAGEGLTMAERRALRKMGKQRICELKEGKSGRYFSLSSPARCIVVAASAFLLLILGGFLLFGPLSQKNYFRDSSSHKFRLTEPKGMIENPPTRFVWIPCEGADIYDFKIIDEDLQTLIHAGTQKTSFALDAATQMKLKRGKKYIWSVEAIAEDSTRLSITRDYFVIKRPGS